MASPHWKLVLDMQSLWKPFQQFSRALSAGVTAGIWWSPFTASAGKAFRLLARGGNCSHRQTDRMLWESKSCNQMAHLSFVFSLFFTEWCRSTLSQKSMWTQLVKNRSGTVEKQRGKVGFLNFGYLVFISYIHLCCKKTGKMSHSNLQLMYLIVYSGFISNIVAVSDCHLSLQSCNFELETSPCWNNKPLHLGKYKNDPLLKNQILNRLTDIPPKTSANSNVAFVKLPLMFFIF